MIQDTTIQRIRTRHVSEYGLEGSPEQETDIPEAKPSANDKWAQSTARGDKGEGRWPHWVAGRPPWSANGPVGPTDLGLLQLGCVLGPHVIGAGLGFWYVGFLLWWAL